MRATVNKGVADAVPFGRHFISKPDLPERIRLGLPLDEYDCKTFYTFDSRGYTDYPFYAGMSTPKRPVKQREARFGTTT